MEILAKSDNSQNDTKRQTLIEHSNALLNILDMISSKDNLNEINNKFVGENVKFNEYLKLICILHDLGKINIKFQHKIKIANKKDELKKRPSLNKNELNNLGRQYRKIKDERHNLLTGAFLKEIFEKMEIEDGIKAVLYKVILLHHDSYDKYMVISNSEIEKAVYEDIEQGIFLNNEYNCKQIQEYLNEKINININFDEKFLDYDYMHYLNENFGGEKQLQYLYILLKGFLNLIDHLASTQIENINYFIPFSMQEIDERIIRLIQKKTKKNNIKFTTMQEDVRKNVDNNILTVAFTGSGKTAADYRWIGKRKIFLVPNKISAESFYKDAEKILEKENVGILHGDISLYVEEENLKKSNEGLTITLRDKNLVRNFAKPYIIATIDQILLAMFKYPGYEKVFASIYDSHITVDEVHLLHPRMFLILIYFIQFSSKYLNTKFHLMTATLPSAYKNKIKECGIDFIESNKNEQIEENKKIKLEIIKPTEKDLYKIIDKGLKENKKILIIKNTVDRAINVFELLQKKYKSRKINLLHSRFKFKDKQKKYDEVLRQFGDIWISTQAVEISLDLDFQIIISDSSPMESTIQRMGRCNRHNTIDCGDFYVVHNEEKDVYDQDIKKETIKLLKGFNKKVLSMKDRKDLLDEYYQVEKIGKYYEIEFNKAQESIKRIFGLNNVDINGEKIIFNFEPYLNIVDNKKEASKLFRDSHLNIKVILEEDFNRLQDNFKFKDCQMESIQISEGFYFKLKNYNAFKIVEGNLVLKEGFCSYDDKIGLKMNSVKKIEEKLISDCII